MKLPWRQSVQLLYNSVVLLGLADARSLTERRNVNAQVDLNTGNYVEMFIYITDSVPDVLLARNSGSYIIVLDLPNHISLRPPSSHSQHPVATGLARRASTYLQ